jgi:iron complex transport system substrate-binding protein
MPSPRCWPRVLLMATLGAFLLTLAACGSDSNNTDRDARAAATSATDAAATAAAGAQSARQEITVTDIVGRSVTLEAPVKSMILSEGRALYIVAPLDREDPFARVAGWADDLRINDFDTYEKYRTKFPHLTKIPIFGSVAQGAFSVEQAIGIAPDLMVLTYDSYVGAKETGLIEKLASAGIPSIVIDFRQYPLENTVPSIALMGRVMGQEQRAQELADFYTENVNLVYSRVETLKQPKPNTFLYRAAGLSDCCGTFGSANMGLLIERAGGLNLGSKFLPGFNGTLNPEQVIVSNPEAIIVTGSNWNNSKPEGGFVTLGYNTSIEVAQEQLRSLVENTPGWESLAAVQQGRVHAIWHQFYISPYQFVVLQQFAKWLYPQAFADIDPDATFREFHERFLPIEYSGTFWTTIR